MQFIETMVSNLSCSSVVMEGLKPIPAVKERDRVHPITSLLHD